MKKRNVSFANNNNKQAALEKYHQDSSPHHDSITSNQENNANVNNDALFHNSLESVTENRPLRLSSSDDEAANKNSNMEKSSSFREQPNKGSNHATSSGSDSGDDRTDNSLDSSDMDVASNISGSTGSSASKALAAKSALPCGMSMPTLMMLVILVPICFLVIYTSIPLAEAASASVFLSEHEQVFIAVRLAGAAASDETKFASEVLILSDETSRFYNRTSAAASTARMNAARNLFDNFMNLILSILDTSSLDERFEMKSEIDSITRNITAQRERIAGEIAISNDYRTDMVELQLRVARLLLYFGNDVRGDLLRARIQNYCLIRRIDVMAQSMLIAARNILVAADGGNGTYDLDEGAALRSRYDTLQADLAFVIDAADPEVSLVVKSFATSASWTSWSRAVRNLLTRNIARVIIYNFTEIDRRSTEVNTFVNSVDAIVLRSIMDGSLLNGVVRDEIIKMIFAIVACILALIAVIFYNRKEQARLERALDSTAVLANAVQRFVPRNQLKTMGVRSITQVTSGMSTEVAQSITFSDIRDFTRLAESMTRLELFDWLQNYVSRMSKVVSEEKSYIMAFLGDGLGICSPQPTYAVNAAIKMHVAVEGLNLDIIAKNGELPVKIGVGIHHGIVVAGVFGDANRLQCSMIAPCVNLASRLEALTKSFGVKTLISESVVDQISRDVFLFRNVGQVLVKGSQKAVKVYDLYQTDSLELKQFKTETKEAFEYAIQLLDSDQEQALREFETLYVKSRMMNIHDLALEMHFARLKDANSNTNNRGDMNDGTSVLSFEKDGTLKTGSNSNMFPPSAQHSFRNYHVNSHVSQLNHDRRVSTSNEGASSPYGPFSTCVVAANSTNSLSQEENSMGEASPFQLSSAGSPIAPSHQLPSSQHKNVSHNNNNNNNNNKQHKNENNNNFFQVIHESSNRQQNRATSVMPHQQHEDILDHHEDEPSLPSIENVNLDSPRHPQQHHVRSASTSTQFYPGSPVSFQQTNNQNNTSFSRSMNKTAEEENKVDRAATDVAVAVVESKTNIQTNKMFRKNVADIMTNNNNHASSVLSSVRTHRESSPPGQEGKDSSHTIKINKQKV